MSGARPLVGAIAVSLLGVATALAGHVVLPLVLSLAAALLILAGVVRARRRDMASGPRVRVVERRPR